MDDPLEREAEQVAEQITEPTTKREGPARAPGTTFTLIQPSRADQDGGLGEVDSSLEAAITGLRGGGQPLPAAEQEFFESRLGYRLGDVHIHTDPRAAQLADALHAEAFTVGRDIAFRTGAFAPGTAEGRHLLAHELTHVIQQTGGSALPSPQTEPVANTSSAQVANPAASDGPVLQAKQIQRRLAADEGVCPVCGKIGKGTCPDCGSPFIPIQRMPAGDDRAPDLAAPVVQRSPWDDVVSFGKGVVNGAAEGLGNLTELGADAFAAIIGQVAPGLAELIRSGPLGKLTELISEGVKGWLQSLLGGVNLGDLIEQLTSSFSSVFATITGVLNGDPASCTSVASSLNGLRDLAQSFAGNPLIQQVKELFGSVQGTFEQVRNLVMAPVVDTLLDLGGSAFDGIKSFAGTIAGWASQIRNVLGEAWDWASEQLGLKGGTDQGGIFEWFKQQAASAWEQLQQMVEPVVGPLKTVGILLLAFSPVGPVYLLIKYGPQLVQMAGWMIKHSGDPDIVQTAHQEMADTILPQILETVQGVGQAAAQVASELTSSALQLGQSVLALLETVSGIPLLSPAQHLVQTLSDNVQQLVRWAGETFNNLVQDIGELFTKVKQTIDPYIAVLTSIGLAIVNPGMIPVIIAGWAWQKLPDCYKPPIIDFLLDICITFLANAPDLPMLGPLWPLLKNGVLGFLEGLRGQDAGTKIAISNRLATIISGANPGFLLGFVRGLLKGLWEGITDPFTTAYTLLSALSGVVDWLESVAAPQTLERSQPSTTPNTGDDGSGPMAGSGETLQQRVQAMADELHPPVEQVTGGFLPAVEEFFSGGEGLTFEQLQQKLGQVWESALSAMQGAGGKLAVAACEFFTKEGADEQIGEGVGWLVGTITLEVVLGILSAGTIAALKPLQGVAKLLTWTDGALEGAFKALSKLGDIVLDGLKGLRSLFSQAAGGAIRAVLDALDEIGAKLLQFGDELLGKVDELARAGSEGADNLVKAADDVTDAAKTVPTGGTNKGATFTEQATPHPGDSTAYTANTGVDEMSNKGLSSGASGSSTGSVFASNQEGLEWFNGRYANRPLGQLSSGYFGPKLGGARQDVLQQALDELDDLMEQYPEAAQALNNLEVVERLKPYPSHSGGVFQAYAAAISEKDSPLIGEIWLSKDTFGLGGLSKAETKVDAGKSVPFPGREHVNFSALIAHEYGHAVHKWLEELGLRDDFREQTWAFILENKSILERLTPSSFGYKEGKIPNEIFAELFASRRVIEAFGSGRIPAHLAHPELHNEDVLTVVAEFSEIIDNLVTRARQ